MGSENFASNVDPLYNTAVILAKLSDPGGSGI